MAVAETLIDENLITGEDLLEMGDIGPCELIDGRVMEMSPVGDEHGFVEFNLGAELRSFVRRHKLGRVIGGEIGIYIKQNPDRIRGADVIVVSKDKLPRLTGRFLEIAPEVVIEIVSPHDRWADIRTKIADYFSIGVEQIWIVEPATRTILIYRSNTDVQELTEDDTLLGEGLLDGFQLKVAEIFNE